MVLLMDFYLNHLNLFLAILSVFFVLFLTIEIVFFLKLKKENTKNKREIFLIQGILVLLILAPVFWIVLKIFMLLNI